MAKKQQTDIETAERSAVWLPVHQATKAVINGRALAWRRAAAGEIEVRQKGAMSEVNLDDLLDAIRTAAEELDARRHEMG